MLKVYEYEKCSTCRKALQFLEKRKIPHERVPIVDRPPTQAELRRMLEQVGGDVRKLFNTSGQMYRELGMGEKLKTLSQAEALKLLAEHGKLVKRPFALSTRVGLVGFREEEWKAAFAKGARS